MLPQLNAQEKVKQKNTMSRTEATGMEDVDDLFAAGADAKYAVGVAGGKTKTPKRSTRGSVKDTTMKTPKTRSASTANIKTPVSDGPVKTRAQRARMSAKK